ncbi:MAG: exodeoxyribonuclease III [Planctomycetaceae bacterium]
MRIVTWNVNGLRAAIRKGFQKHLDAIHPDILLLQEVRARPEQLPDEFQHPDGWHVVWNPAQRPGYSGTAIWSRTPINVVKLALSDSAQDDEGRIIEADIRGIRLACVYLPSGSSGFERQTIKESWMKKFRRWTDSRPNDMPMFFGATSMCARKKTSSMQRPTRKHRGSCRTNVSG